MGGRYSSTIKKLHERGKKYTLLAYTGKGGVERDTL
jgi:hypothetical protein